MSFAGVSLIVNGKLKYGTTCPPTCSTSGYHLIVVEGHSRTRQSMWTRGFIVGGYSWIIKYNPDDGDFISLHLYLTERSLLADAVKAQFSFSLVDETDKQEPTRIYGSKITEFINYNEKGYHRFMTRKDMEKSKHLRDDSFTIRYGATSSS